MPPLAKKNHFLNKLQKIVKTLRGPQGCPWDQEQTMASITPHIIEEANELIESIHNDNPDEIKEELGDVLLHVVMLSEFASEKDLFDFEAVAENACKKMIRRHPHVFGKLKVKNAEDVCKNWKKIKNKEKEISNQKKQTTK